MYLEGSLIYAITKKLSCLVRCDLVNLKYEDSKLQTIDGVLQILLSLGTQAEILVLWGCLSTSRVHFVFFFFFFFTGE